MDSGLRQIVVAWLEADDAMNAGASSLVLAALDGRRACHHHPYELAPTAGELRCWFSVVEELIQKTD